MTAAVTIRAEQGQVSAVGRPTNATDVTVEQGQTLVPARATAVEISAEQAEVSVSVRQDPDVQVEQATTFVVARGRINNRRLRAWTFTLDGHDFYVLRLGETHSLVYDMSTETWSMWQSPDDDTWRAHMGAPWIGMGKTSLLNTVTRIVAGDDTTGYLWTLNPYIGYDEDTDQSQNAFTRKVLGGIGMRTRKTQPVGGAYLTCSVGSPQVAGATFTLRTSDDYGKSWTNHGSITSATGDYTQELSGSTASTATARM
jgi:hypothetical protein